MVENESSMPSHPIEWFRVSGVHGYKDLLLEMKNKTTIFVSENGAGKTTALNALKAILERDFHSLKLIKFTEITIKFTNSKEVKIKRDELGSHSKEDIKSFIDEELSLSSDFWENNSLEATINSIITSKDYNYRDDNVLHDIYMNTPFIEPDYIKSLEKLKLKINFGSNFTEESKVIEEAMLGYEVIYLPTYRRVEKNLDKNRAIVAKRPNFRRTSIKKLHHDGISYGLRDVEETLSEMTLEIERLSSTGYRTLSAKMLDDLIRLGDSNFEFANNDLPSIEDLERFLNRVENPQHTYPQHGPFEPKKKENTLIRKLKTLYDDDKVKETGYLNYFLSKLNIVIQQTKEQEYKIEQFVEICNKYLTSSGDSKSLRFDPSKLEVIVNDDFTGSRISLNDLSSGEKQVISLMAILYLGGDDNKIILIDEPELSLSLKWQKMILPDIDKAKKVNQVVAITHSPFIFDNELEKSATSMKIRRAILDEQ